MDLIDWIRAAAALAATLALLALGAYVARRLAPLTALGGAPTRLKVVERLALDPRRQVMIVRMDGEEHLLLLSPFGDRRIASRPAPTEPAPPAEPSP